LEINGSKFFGLRKGAESSSADPVPPLANGWRPRAFKNPVWERTRVLASSSSTAQGIAIYNMLRALPVSVTTYNIGSVNSIGNVIFLAGSKRYASRTSSFMFHGVGFDVQTARFEEKMLKERLQGLQNDQKLIADIIVRHTKISAVEAEKLFLEAAFVGTAEAKRLGIIDDVLDIQIPPGAPFLQLVFQR
jgi:hypothetical protein